MPEAQREGGQTISASSFLLRASSVVEVVPEKLFYVSGAFNRRWVKIGGRADGTLSNLRTFVKQGECGSAVDREGRLYVAGNLVYAWHGKGEPPGSIRLPGRSTSLAVGGKDGKILFRVVRSSLYLYKIVN